MPPYSQGRRVVIGTEKRWPPKFMNRERLKKMITRHEGISLKIYTDQVGIQTIGIGRNLEANGISLDEAELMLENDIRKCIEQLSQFHWWANLDDVRQEALIDLTFNIGIGGVKFFKKMLAALADENYSLAAAELHNSLYAKQVPSRAKEIGSMLFSGKYK